MLQIGITSFDCITIISLNSYAIEEYCGDYVSQIDYVHFEVLLHKIICKTSLLNSFKILKCLSAYILNKSRIKIVERSSCFNNLDENDLYFYLKVKKNISKVAHIVFIYWSICRLQVSIKSFAILHI